MNDLQIENILILGFGREGQSTLRFLNRQYPGKKIVIADKKNYLDWDNESKALVKNNNVEVVTGTKYLNSLTDFGVVFKSPGVPNKLAKIKEAREAGVKFTSQTQLFFDLCKGKIIGITGTKGKSTTASLINHILQSAKVTCELLGNIGKPPLDYLEFDNDKMWFVYELSSHQLADLNKSPAISVLLNIFYEHQDYYENIKDYLSAKENITRFQDSENIFIYNADVPEFEEVAKTSKANKFAFSLNKKKMNGCFVDNGYLVLKNKDNLKKVIATDQIPLLGSHNLNNVMASVLACYYAGVSIKDVRQAITTFTPLPNRLEIVGVYQDITFVCDALATIPEATIAALSSFQNNVSTLICGGFDRGQDFSKLAEKIIETKIKNLILFPTTGNKIRNNVEILNEKNDLSLNYFQVKSMEDAVKLSYKNSEKGKVCLLSAASPSFGLFKDYEEEAKLFKYYIKKLA